MDILGVWGWALEWVRGPRHEARGLGGALESEAEGTVPIASCFRGLLNPRASSLVPRALPYRITLDKN